MAKYILTVMFLGLLTLVFFDTNTVSDFDSYKFQVHQEKVIRVEEPQEESVAIQPTAAQFPSDLQRSTDARPNTDIAATVQQP
ncbi:MAG: hypothetical protein AAFV95_20560 [Bacteroidota bacterium]